jgi:hypothetical protein
VDTIWNQHGYFCPCAKYTRGSAILRAYCFSDRTRMSCVIVSANTSFCARNGKTAEFPQSKPWRPHASGLSRHARCSLFPPNTQPMPRYQHEAAKACAPYSSLFKGTSRSTRYDQRHHGVVGSGCRDQTVFTAGLHIFGHLNGSRLPRQANHSPRTSFLSLSRLRRSVRRTWRQEGNHARSGSND